MLFDALADGGLDPADCDLDPGETRQTIMITHRSTDSLFVAYGQKVGFLIDWAVTDGPARRQEKRVAWRDVLDEAEDWAREVGYVATTPDRWEEVRRLPRMLADEADDSNAPFTADEQATIALQLAEIRQLLRQQPDLTSEQLASIEQRLDHAEQASTRLGRKDWLLILYGGLVSMVMANAVPSAVIQSVMVTVAHGIGHLFGGPPPTITA